MRLTVLGTGLMGSAVVRQLLAGGHEITVWNRTADRTAPLVEVGAKAEASVSEALRATDTALLCLLDYDICRRVLAEAQDAIAGRNIVNLATGKPKEAEEFAAAVAGWGGGYLDGAIEAYPEGIGESDALINLAGSTAVWEATRPVLLELGGGSVFVGTSPGLANVLDAALAGAFHNIALGGFLEAVSYATRAGVTTDALRDSLDYWVALLHHVLKEGLDAVDKNDFATDQVTLDVYLAAVRSWRESMISAGVRAPLMTANLHTLELTQAAGHGSSSIFAQVLTAGADRR
ncbi:MAG: NAD(P)-dependent oxidoreductase [Propionibacteriales bacterium]|nr:NAD(P)-dependent oxidoreductase [Propionibacteriales bacterium]